MNDERIARAAAVRLALPATKRRVASPSPSPRIVVEVFGAAELVDRFQIVLDGLGHVVEEQILVHGPMRSALGAGPVVADHHDDRVVELTELLEEREEAPDLMIGVLEEAREHFHHARIESLLVGAEAAPLLHVRIVRGELGAFRQEPHLHLAFVDLRSICVPAIVEHALVLVGPLARNLVRCVRGARAEVSKERFLWGDLLGVGDEPDHAISQVGSEVITLFRSLRRRDLVVVVHEVRVVLARVAAHESVEALEAARERPAIVRSRGAALLARREVPLADGEGVVSVRLEDLRKETVLERNEPVGARKTRRPFGDARHRVRVVITPRDDARATRRAERGRMHVAVAETVRREAVQVRRLDRRAVTTELPVARVVEHDEQDVRRARLRAQRLRPCRLRLVDRSPDHARKRSACLVLFDRHARPCARTMPHRQIASRLLARLSAPRPNVREWTEVPRRFGGRGMRISRPTRQDAQRPVNGQSHAVRRTQEGRRHRWRDCGARRRRRDFRGARASYAGQLPDGMSVTLLEGERAFGGRAGSAPVGRSTSSLRATSRRRAARHPLRVGVLSALREILRRCSALSRRRHADLLRVDGAARRSRTRHRSWKGRRGARVRSRTARVRVGSACACASTCDAPRVALDARASVGVEDRAESRGESG